MTIIERARWDALMKRRHEYRKQCALIRDEMELIRGRVWARARYREMKNQKQLELGL